MLSKAGFRVPAALFAASREELGALDLSGIPGDDVVLKLISEDMPHRTEHGGVRFVRKDPSILAETFDSFSSICGRLGAGFSGMMIAERLDIDDSLPHQLLLSLRQDPSFGPVVVLGLGGLGTEVYREGLKEEKGLLIAPASMINDREAVLGGLEKTLFYPVITGRTRISREEMVGPDAVLEALSRFAALAEAFSADAADTGVTIEEIEVNPLQITGGTLVPLDGLMRISKRKTFPAYPPQEKIEKLLRPGTILIIGVSAARRNMGRIILQNMLAGHSIDRENIWLLHPKAGSIDGCRAFASLDDLPGKADLVVFTIPAGEPAVELLEELIRGEKAESIILISGGFGETSDGKHLDDRIRQAIAAARSRSGGGTVLNGPNCMGVVSRPGGYNTFFLPEYKFSVEGRYGDRTAIVSQSGAWLVTLMNTQASQLNPRYMITLGNQMDITLTDYLVNLSNDPDIDLFCLYIEGFRELDGRRFLDVARRIMDSGKRIVVYKAGRTAEGAAAAASHTAAMAADHDVFSQLVESAGIYQAGSLEDIEDAVKVLTLLGGRKIRGRRVGISSDAGYECAVAADRLYSMELSEFTGETLEELSRHLPDGIVDAHNPVDTTPAISSPEYGKCVEAIISDPNVDCAVVSNVASTSFQENLPAGPGHREDITRENSHPSTLIRIFESTDKPMVICLNEGAIYDPAVAMMEEAGIPVFRKIDRAMKAMDIFLRYGGR